MQQYNDRRGRVAAIRQELAIKIKLDIAQTIRHHPHLEREDSQRAYRELASDETVDDLIRELAREEIEAAIERGDLPPAATLASLDGLVSL